MTSINKTDTGIEPLRKISYTLSDVPLRIHANSYEYNMHLKKRTILIEQLLVPFTAFNCLFQLHANAMAFLPTSPQTLNLFSHHNLLPARPFPSKYPPQKSRFFKNKKIPVVKITPQPTAMASSFMAR